LSSDKERLFLGYFQAVRAVINSSTAEDGLNKALKILGKATNVDRVYICRHQVDGSTDEMYFSLQYEWAADNVDRQISSPNFRKISYSRFSLLNFFENLSNGRILKFVLKDLSPDHRSGFLDSKIKSVILIPVKVDNTYWGFMGFDELKLHRVWTEDEEAILAKMASNLSVLIKEEKKGKFSVNDRGRINFALVDEASIVSFFDVNDKPKFDFFVNILNVYLRDIPLMVEEIDNAIKEKEMLQLKHYAHKLAGSLLNLGAESVAEICYQLENYGKENVLNDTVIALNVELKLYTRKLVDEIISLREKFFNSVRN
jgi:HPt (histidine-containing phosphotransfer) domain-containing protein